MKIKMNVDIGGLIKKIKFSRQEDKSDRPRVKQKRKGAIEFKKEENSEVKEVENVYNLEQTKKRRGKKEYNENDLVENGEKKKNWKRKGSKKNLSEFFKNIFLNQRQIKFNYYVLLFAMIILCSGSFYLTSKSYKKYNEEDYETYNAISTYSGSEDISSSEEKSADEITEEESNSIIKQKQEIISSIKESESTDKDNTTSKNTSTTNTTKKSNNVSTTTKKVEKLEFTKPHEGQVQKLYSKDTLIYSKTLEMWKIHEGIDISGSVGDIIKASEKGEVTKIYDDSFLGKTIVIDHGQGYKTSYSNLGGKLYVSVGTNVKKGQKIGEIGTSSIGEIKDEPHLHFMLYKNDEIVDPSNIFYT